MKDLVKAMVVWAVCLVAGNLLIVGLTFLFAAIADAFHITIPTVPGQPGPTMLSQHLMWGEAGVIALFNVFMGVVLLLLLMWLVGSLVVLGIETALRQYARQQVPRGRNQP
jgi:hypothetical protein